MKIIVTLSQIFLSYRYFVLLIASQNIQTQTQMLGAGPRKYSYETFIKLVRGGDNKVNLKECQIRELKTVK